MDTPTGLYDPEYIQKISSVICENLKGQWFDREDVAQDLCVELLSGSSLPNAYKVVKKKYGHNLAVTSIDSIPDHFLKDMRYEEQENVGKVSFLERKALISEFEARLATLPLDSQMLVVLRSHGYKDRDLAKALKLKLAFVRTKLHRALEEMKK